MRFPVVRACAVVFGVGSAAALAGAPLARAGEPCEVTRLGDLLGGNFLSSALDVSADGETIVGFGSSASGNEAFRWTASEGMQGLGDLPGGQFYSAAHGVSADGAFVVGAGIEATGTLPVRWVDGGEPIPLGLVEGYTGGRAFDVSGDGSRIVGTLWEQDGGPAAFEWTPAAGSAVLEAPAEAAAVSADGTTVAGCRYFPENPYNGPLLPRAAMWPTRSDPASGPDGCATGISGDGELAIGTHLVPDLALRFEGWLWEGLGPEIPLPTFPLVLLQPRSVSADGRMVVGPNGHDGPSRSGFVWTERDGLRSLDQILAEDCGLDLGVDRVVELNGISADGRILVGRISGEDGEEAVRVRLPEPAGSAAAAGALLAAGAAWRRGSVRRRGDVSAAK